ncbi:hypothetical protein ACLB2K_019151 [Fragaria x ananassa]
MNVTQLREEATLRGVLATGSKKELLERLCEDSGKDSDDIAATRANEEGNDSKEKMVTATKKGSAVLDQWLPDHIKTHYHVLQLIFRASREGEAERYRKFLSMKNRMLLWHGSRLTNWAGILSQGLRIAPPEAPVALGDMAELLTAKYDADKLPEGKLSTKGVGGTEPDLSEAQLLEDGVMVPLGKPKENPCKGALLYNEYIVYNVNQIRMRYVVQVNFKFKR